MTRPHQIAWMMCSQVSVTPTSTIFFLIISIAAFVFEAFALVDALRRPAPAFVARG